MKLTGFIFEYPTGKANKISENLTSEEYSMMWMMLTTPIPPEMSRIQGYLILKEEGNKNGSICDE